MKNPDRVVTWCLLLVASSFWIKLAWQYGTGQTKDSFFVGPALFATALTLAVDVLLLMVAAYGASSGVVRRQLAIRQVVAKWTALLALVALSLYFETKALLYLFPFFQQP